MTHQQSGENINQYKHGCTAKLTKEGARQKRVADRFASWQNIEVARWTLTCNTSNKPHTDFGMGFRDGVEVLSALGSSKTCNRNLRDSAFSASVDRFFKKCNW